MRLGERIRTARKARDMTQERLAKLAGIRQPSLSELESGESKSISGEVLIGISGALRVRPEWIMNERGPMEPDASSASQV